jgi:hypothetical protein
MYHRGLEGPPRASPFESAVHNPVRQFLLTKGMATAFRSLHPPYVSAYKRYFRPLVQAISVLEPVDGCKRSDSTVAFLPAGELTRIGLGDHILAVCVTASPRHAAIGAHCIRTRRCIGQRT